MAAGSRKGDVEPVRARRGRGARASEAQPTPTSETMDPVSAAPQEWERTARRVMLDAAFKDKADLAAGLTENLQRAAVRNRSVEARVDGAFAAFSPAGPAIKGAPPAHVEPAADPFEMQSAAIDRKLDQWRSASGGPGIAIRADSALIDWSASGSKRGGHRTGAIDLGKLIDMINAGANGDPSIASLPAVAACEAQLRAQAIIDEIERPAGGATRARDGYAPDPGGDDAGADPADGDDGGHRSIAARSVNEMVAGQMASATAPEDRLTYGLIPNGADRDPAQAGLLDTFELRPGPTDVTSYHDFSALQIAFEDVWTRIFDGELETLGRQVYREYVGLKDFLGYDPQTADRPISSLDDLAWLIGEIRALSELGEEALPGGDGAAGAPGGAPKGASGIAREAEKIVESLPGGRVGTAVATLGVSEFVLWVLGQTGELGKKPALKWDDLVNDRALQRGDRIAGKIDQGVTATAQIELLLRTDIGAKKEVAFQLFNQGTGKMDNIVKVSNFSPPDPPRSLGTRTINGSDGRPRFYEHSIMVPTPLLATGMLEFSSQETPTYLLGRYVLGDLDKIVPGGARLTLYWKDS